MAMKCMVCGKGCRHDQVVHSWCEEKVRNGQARYLTIEEQRAGVTVD
jgi:hypothetical protein